MGKVVEDFYRVLPESEIYVYDNKSYDNTSTAARDAGAHVVLEIHRGKGRVIASMFRNIDADVYVIVDGDDTYPAESVGGLVRPVLEGSADMVVGSRLDNSTVGAFRRFHRIGNRLVTQAVNLVCGSDLTDVMSGYRVVSRVFVEQVPVVSHGFEVETEITVQALYRGMIINEIPIRYRTRPKWSQSKLSTFRDGIRILLTVVNLIRVYRPITYFSTVAVILGAASISLGSRLLGDLSETGEEHSIIFSVVAAVLAAMALGSVGCGLVMDGMNHLFAELTQLQTQRSGVESRPRSRRQ